MKLNIKHNLTSKYGVVPAVTAFALIALLFLGLIVLSPLVVIWALNTLFMLGIPYTFYTWLAVIVLNLTLLGNFNLTTNKGE